MRPRISLITTMKNAEHCIEKTLCSVLEQNYQPLQYVVMDGGSTDDTLALARKYADRCDVHSIPDANPTEGINHALALVDGDMLGFINAGDWYEPGALETVAARYKPGAILHGNLKTWVRGRPAHIVHPNARDIRREMCVNFPCCFFCAPLVKSFDHAFDYATDYEYILRCLEQGAHFCHVDATLANMPLDGRSSEHWALAYRDAAKSRIRHGEGCAAVWLHFARQIMKTSCRIALEGCGLHGIVSLYRRRGSVKKSPVAQP